MVPGWSGLLVTRSLYDGHPRWPARSIRTDRLPPREQRGQHATRAVRESGLRPAVPPAGAARRAVPPALLARPRRPRHRLFTVLVSLADAARRRGDVPGAAAVERPGRPRGRGGAGRPAGRAGDRVVPVAGPLRAGAGPAAGARVRLGRARRHRRRPGPAVARPVRARHPGRPWPAAVVAPITEEGAKGLFILLLLWFRRRVIDGVLDGIVYAGLVGVGFAFTENILYLGARLHGR